MKVGPEFQQDGNFMQRKMREWQNQYASNDVFKFLLVDCD